MQACVDSGTPLEGGPPGSEGVLERTIVASSVTDAWSWFKQMARELCELRGEPWTAHYVRNVDSFQRGSVRLRHDAERIHLSMRIEAVIATGWIAGPGG